MDNILVFFIYKLSSTGDNSKNLKKAFFRALPHCDRFQSAKFRNAVPPSPFGPSCLVRWPYYCPTVCLGPMQALLLSGMHSIDRQLTVWDEKGGGINWNGEARCVSGYYCNQFNAYYSQCIPGAASPTTSKGISSCSTSTYVCEDFVNSCGMTYGGCYLAPSCGGAVPTFTAPTCGPPTPSSTTTTCSYTRCEDHINSCGMTYGGCFLDPLCGGTFPTFTIPTCSNTVTIPPSGCPFTECAYVSNPCGPSIRTCFLAGACGGTTPGPRTSTCAPSESTTSWIYTTSNPVSSSSTTLNFYTTHMPRRTPAPTLI